MNSRQATVEKINGEKLSPSQYLSIQPHQGYYVVYNKLLGNFSVLSQQAYEYLCRNNIDNNENTPLIQQLKERFFLLPDNIDERDIINNEIRYRKEHLDSGYLVNGLQLVLTNDCNFKCTYCFANERNNDQASSCAQKPQRMTKEIAFLAVENIISVIKRNHNTHLTIEFFGGEPLLNWEIIEAVLDKYRSGEDWGVNIHYMITTNGSLISEKIAKTLKTYGVHTVLSYDTPGNHHRLTTKNTPAEELILRGLSNLKKHNNAVSINSVISHTNIDQFDADALLEFAAYYHIGTLALILDLSSYPYDDAVIMKRITDAILYTCIQARKYAINITGYWHQIFEQITDIRPINLTKGYKTCPAEGCKISVEPDGAISNCKCVDTKIGTINDLDAVFTSERYQLYAMKAYITTPFCEGCEIEGFCSGLCMGTLDLEFNNISAVIPTTCQLYRGLTRQLLAEHLTHYREEDYLHI
ncbi:radical SAM/SPASM domain-containing protein [Musicola paradisiaca]|uniref:Radical SAM domain protein n=2 Tax=Musicola paradisiaca TaxID=69223 RepID=C6CAB9_MUSP7|nr:radical SAM protein [Musicola paradisiaca]ACS84594.1 Radical SAM domain protein [Musicola paradisiaca Ech703]